MRTILTVAVAGVITAASAVSAGAVPVLVLQGKRVHVRDERLPGAAADLPGASVPAPRGARHGRRAFASGQAAKGLATRQALDQLLAQGQIDQPTHDARVASLNDALGAWRPLSGTRQAELGAVIDNADVISSAGQLSASRLAAVFGTLDANRQWWTTGPLLSSGQRVSVGSSPLIWQYYPGQGIELQMLANFAKANALWSSGDNSALSDLMTALVALRADRGGWPAWEYYFRFDGGVPPWTSAISEGTAVQALARAGQRLHDQSLTTLGQQTLAAFQQAPPAGVRFDTPSGPFYLIYSFAPNQLVINAHLQAVIGLHDFAQITGDPVAQTLFQQGDAEAQVVLPHYDTGKWSLYDQTTESDLNYHQLVTTFLTNLCQRTKTPIYCDTASRFRAYMTQSPTVAALTRTLRSGAPGKLRFSLDKISRVSLTVLTTAGSAAFSTSAVVGHGTHFFTWSRPGRPGLYRLRLRATDLAGNQSAPASARLQILPARKPRKRSRRPGR